jgi:hypothetical protein
MEKLLKNGNNCENSVKINIIKEKRLNGIIMVEKPLKIIICKGETQKINIPM